MRSCGMSLGEEVAANVAHTSRGTLEGNLGRALSSFNASGDFGRGNILQKRAMGSLSSNDWRRRLAYPVLIGGSIAGLLWTLRLGSGLTAPAAPDSSASLLTSAAGALAYFAFPCSWRSSSP